jgi:cytochrome b
MNIVAMLVVAGCFSFIAWVCVGATYFDKYRARKDSHKYTVIGLFIFAALCFILAAGLGIKP